MTFAKLCKYIRIATYVAIIIDAAIKIVKTARGEDEKTEKKKQQTLFEADSKPGSLKGGSGWVPASDAIKPPPSMPGIFAAGNPGRLTSVFGMGKPVTVAEAVKRTMAEVGRAENA